MSTKRASVLTAILVGSALVLGGCAALEPTPALEKIIITGNPQDDDPNPIKRFQLLIDLVEEATGLPVEFYDAPDYAGVAEAITTGRAQLAHMEAFTYVVATKRNPELKLIAGSGRGPGQIPGYYSWGITRVESDIYSLADLKGKHLCFADPASAGSYLVPGQALKAEGIDHNPLTSNDITGIFTGSITSVGVGVFNQDCDAGFVTDGTMKNSLTKVENVNVDELRMFWESEMIPGPPLVAHPSIPQEMLDAIQALILEKANKDYMIEQGMCDVAANCEFLNNTVWGYVPNQDSYYDPIRQLCEEAKLEECQ